MGELSKSWYTKYRPTTIDEYSGKELRDIIERRFSRIETMPHVVMLKGERGCGKTTLARLLSKYYHCENLTEKGPCEECEMCQQINEQLIHGAEEGLYIEGVTEIDATTTNGKDAINGVLEEAQQPPTYTKYKVLILDECHEISRAAQNSMLKILEDIPPHLIVIFATTDYDKVLQTIKSRCQLTLTIKPQTVPDMVARLLQISEMEGLTVSEAALEAIVKSANCVPRESINLLETIAMTYDRQVNLENVKKYVGDVSSSWYLNYFEAANSSLEDILIFIKELEKANISLPDFTKGLSKFTMSSLYIKHGIALEDYPKEYVKSIKGLFDTYTASDFDVVIQVVNSLLTKVGATDSRDRDALELVIAAMRLNKVGLLAQGLGLEKNQAAKENHISVAEHGKSLRATNIKAIDKLRLDLDMETLHENFEDLHVVKSDEPIISQDIKDKIDSIIASDEEKRNEAKKQSEESSTFGSEVDDFFDN